MTTDRLDNISIGIIGTGNMGGAITAALASNIKEGKITCFDSDFDKTEKLKNKYNIDPADSIIELVKKSSIVILSVKPDTVHEVLKKISDHCGGKTIVSIAAGIDINSMEALLAPSQAIVRAMPNTPALIGEGMTVLSPNGNISTDSLTLIEQIFKLTGRVLVLPEKLMDAVTGLSGSGPAYVFSFIQAMTDGGVRMGIPREEALTLTVQTVLGAAKMILETGEEPMVLRGRVTSPGGTTIEGINRLERSGFAGIIMEAVEAAVEKSKKLGGIK